MSFFYAFYNNYGIGTADTDGNRIGELRVFDTKRERDEWVDEEDYSGGNLHREAISGKEARAFAISYLYNEAPVSSNILYKEDIERLSTDELMKLYRENLPYTI